MLRSWPHETEIHSSTQLRKEKPAEQASERTSPATDTTFTTWPTVVEELGSAVATPGRLELLTELAKLGVSEPQAGEEVGSQGIMVDLAWPESRVAVIFEPEPDDKDVLAEDGWTLVASAASDITMALGMTAGEGHHG